MKVVGLATTNTVESIRPLSDIQIADYQGVSYQSLVSQLF
jgi:hypothetical protein